MSLINQCFAVIVFLAVHFLCGLPFLSRIPVHHRKFSILTAWGFLVTQMSLLFASYLGYAANISSIYVYLFWGGIGAVVTMALWPSKLWIINWPGLKMSVALVCYVVISILIASKVHKSNYNLFYFQSDTIPYLALADYFWDNLPFKYESGVWSYNNGLLDSFLMNEIRQFRVGNWGVQSLLYLLFGRNELAYFAAVNISISIIAFCVSIHIHRSLISCSSATTTSIEHLVFCSPMFLLCMYESYFAQTLSAPFLLMSLFSSYRLASDGRIAIKELTFFSINVLGLFLFFPEFIMLPFLALVVFFYVCRPDGAGVWDVFGKITIVMFFSIAAALILGNVLVIKNATDLIARYEVGDVGYSVLIDAFPGFSSVYIFNTIGALHYPRIFSARLINISVILAVAILLATVARVEVAKLNRPLLAAMLIILLLFALLSSYATVKVISILSLIVTPMYLRYTTPKLLKHMVIGLLTIGTLAVIIGGPGYNWGKRLYEYIDEIEQVRQSVTTQTNRDSILLVTQDYELNGLLGLMLARTSNRLYSSNPVLGRGYIANNKYDLASLKKCEQIKEEIVLIKNDLIKAENLGWIKECKNVSQLKEYKYFTIVVFVNGDKLASS